MDQPTTATPPNPFFERLEAAVDQFGRTERQTQSRRHGHQPKAREHVEDYLAHAVLGESVRSIARSRGKSIGAVHESIQRGKALVQSQAASIPFPISLPTSQPEPDEPDDPWDLD